jgi:hypothetical protein
MIQTPTRVLTALVFSRGRHFFAGTRTLALCLVLVVGLAGCASVRAVNTASPSSIRGGLQIGDQVTVTTRDNRQRELTVSGLSDIGIDAQIPDGSFITIPYWSRDDQLYSASARASVVYARRHLR